MKNKKSMKEIIVFYVTGITVTLGVILTIILIVASMMSTVSVLSDSLQMSAKTSAQNISSNLHLLTDRLDNLAQDENLNNLYVGYDKKQTIIDNVKSRIEFRWIAIYDPSGNKDFGDDEAPENISDTSYFDMLELTQNITIGEPENRNGRWEICVGTPLYENREGSVYLVGSYDYGIMNDVLSNISISKSDSAYILNENGDIIADKNPVSMESRDNVYNIYNSKAAKKAFDKAIAFQTGVESAFLKGRQTYIAYSPIAGTNWTLIISAPGFDFMQILMISIIVCIIFIFVLQIVSRKIIVKVADVITNAIALAGERLTILSAGNLNEEVILNDTSKEAEALTMALSATVTGLGKYIDEIRSYLGLLSQGDYSVDAPDNFDGDFVAIRDALTSISLSLNETMCGISDASVAVSSNSSETTQYAKRLYDGSQEQTEALERLSLKIEEISEKINDIDENANRVKKSADIAGDKVDQGKTQMDYMLSTMNSINDKMQEIVAISNMIEEISSQTSLLALNASIEAARAGEAGKGFAVVAQQIGILADQTADALTQTGDIINQVRNTIGNGLETARITGESFENVRTATEEFADISDKMTYIAAEQKDRIQTITDEVQKVLKIAEENQGLAKETDEIAEQSLKQAENLENIVSAVKLRS